MTFTEWAAKHGYDEGQLTALQRGHLEHAWRAETGPGAAALTPDLAVEAQRVEAIDRVLEVWLERSQGADADKLQRFHSIADEARSRGWDARETELKMLRAD